MCSLHICEMSVKARFDIATWSLSTSLFRRETNRPIFRCLSLLCRKGFRSHGVSKKSSFSIQVIIHARGPISTLLLDIPFLNSGI